MTNAQMVFVVAGAQGNLGKLVFTKLPAGSHRNFDLHRRFQQTAFTEH